MARKNLNSKFAYQVGEKYYMKKTKINKRALAKNAYAQNVLDSLIRQHGAYITLMAAFFTSMLFFAGFCFIVYYIGITFGYGMGAINTILTTLFLTTLWIMFLTASAK